MEVPFIDIHTHSQSKSSGIRVASFFLGDNIEEAEDPICVGLHPWHTDGSGSDLESQFTPYLERMVALGEIGLDRSIQVPIKKQAELFVAQLKIAQRHHLPVVIHCVKAYSDILAVMPAYKELTYIFHGFYANEQILKSLLPYNSYFSMGIRELQRPKGAALIRSIPINRLFLETDESRTAIEDVYNTASEATGIDITELREQLYNNYTHLFK